SGFYGRVNRGKSLFAVSKLQAVKRYDFPILEIYSVIVDEIERGEEIFEVLDGGEIRFIGNKLGSDVNIL
ncbi:MAG: hypothetical protein WBI24_02955, partial [Bacilli bacterium]